jgi:hypothetical protein
MSFWGFSERERKRSGCEHWLCGLDFFRHVRPYFVSLMLILFISFNFYDLYSGGIAFTPLFFHVYQNQ